MLLFNIFLISALISLGIVWLLLSLLELKFNSCFEWNPFDCDRWFGSLVVGVFWCVIAGLLIIGDIFMAVYSLLI